MAKILISDEDVELLETHRMLLQHVGHQVVTASNVAEALAAAAQGDFTLVVTDIAMTEMNGSELIAVLRKKSPELRIIATTAPGVVLNATYAMIIASRLGAVTTIPRPVSGRQLLVAVREVLAAPLAPPDALPRMASAA